MKKIFVAALAAAALNVAPASAATDLIVNGGFELTTTSSPTGNFQIGTGGAGSVTGWSSTVNGAYNLLFKSSNANTVAGNAAGAYSGTNNEFMWASTASSQGGNFVALDGDSNVRGALTQLVTGLVVGTVYDLAFEWGAGQIHSRTGATTEQLQVSFGGNSFNTAVLNNPSQGFTGWNTVNHSFVATSTSELLSFLSVGTPNGLPPVALLDNVRLTAAVPEPATWAMMIFGFGAIGSITRSRRSRNLAAA